MTAEDKLNQIVLIKKLKTLQKTKKNKNYSSLPNREGFKRNSKQLSYGIKLFRIKMHQNFEKLTKKYES